MGRPDARHRALVVPAPGGARDAERRDRPVRPPVRRLAVGRSRRSGCSRSTPCRSRSRSCTRRAIRPASPASSDTAAGGRSRRPSSSRSPSSRCCASAVPCSVSPGASRRAPIRFRPLTPVAPAAARARRAGAARPRRGGPRSSASLPRRLSSELRAQATACARACERRVDEKATTSRRYWLASHSWFPRVRRRTPGRRRSPSTTASCSTPPPKRLAGVSVAILDGDRDLRLRVHGTTLVVRGDLGEPMLRLAPSGTWVNRASVTAVAERLTTPGTAGCASRPARASPGTSTGSAPPPYDGSRLGSVARFTIPATVDGRPVTIGGTFVRYAQTAAVAVAARRGGARRGRGGRREAVARAAAARSATVLGGRCRPGGSRRSGGVRRGRCAERTGRVGPDRARSRARGGRVRRARPAARRAAGASAAGSSASRQARSASVRCRCFRHGVVISLLPATASRALCVGCARGRQRPRPRRATSPRRRVIAAPPPAVYPWPIGVGPRYHPSAANSPVLGGAAGRHGCAARAERGSPCTSSCSPRREVVIVPPGIGVARSGLQLSAAHDRRRPASSTSRPPGRWTLGDLFRVWGRRLGPSALLSFHGASRCSSAAAGGPAIRARLVLTPARPDRARGRRLRRAASQLPLPERSLMTRRPRSCCRSSCWSLLLAGCGGSSSPTSPDDRRRRARTRSSTSSRPARSVAGKPTVVSFMIRQPNGKPLTHFKRGPGPAHGRAPDHRAARPRDDRAPASADRGGRDDQRDDHVHRAGPVPRRRRRVSRHDRPAARTSSCSRRCRSPARTCRRSCRRSRRRSVVGRLPVHDARPAEPARDPGRLR